MLLVAVLLKAHAHHVGGSMGEKDASEPERSTAPILKDLAGGQEAARTRTHPIIRAEPLKNTQSLPASHVGLCQW